MESLKVKAPQGLAAAGEQIETPSLWGNEEPDYIVPCSILGSNKWDAPYICTRRITEEDFRETNLYRRLPTAETIREKGLHYLLARELNNPARYDVFAARGEHLYRYNNGVYKPVSFNDLRTSVSGLRKLWDQTARFCDDLIKRVYSQLPADSPQIPSEPITDLINFTNCLYDVDTGAVYFHTPDVLSTVQIPVELDLTYDQCPAIDDFIKHAFAPDAQDIAYMIIASLLVPGLNQIQSILLISEPGCGKSVWLDLLNTLIGQENCSHVPLQDLAGRFNKAQLVDKLVNIGGDLSPDELRRLGTFKSATGSDTILVEEKMERPYSAKLFARHVYSTNRQFAARDDSGALTERFYPIVFQKKWRGQAGERSPEEMHVMLCDEEELIGVVTKALRYLPQVRTMRSLPIPASVKEALNELESATDPFKRWFDLAIEPESSEVSYLPVPVAVAEYNCFLHQLYPNLAPLSADAFGRRMAKMLKSEKKQHVVRGKHGVWCYESVCLRYDTLTAGGHQVGEGWGPHCLKEKQPGSDAHEINFDMANQLIVRKDWRS